MPAANEEVPAFIITELNGRRRSLTLTARALPHRPASWTRTQRVSVNYNPGNPEGTSSVLGPAQTPSTFSGEWKEMYLAEGAAAYSASGGKFGGGNGAGGAGFLKTARDLVRFMDSMVDSGALLEVRWFIEIRRGHLTSFKTEWANTHDVAWEMEFEWVGKGEIPKRSNTRAAQEPAAVADTLGSAIQATAANLGNPPAALNPSRLEQMRAAFGQVENSIQQLRDGVNTAARQALTPYDSARRTMSVLSGVVGEATEMVTTVTSVPPEELFHLATGVDPTNFGQGFRAAAAAYADSQARGARRLAREAALVRTDMVRDAQNDLLAVHEAKRGEDLRDVSSRYYGSSAQWRALLVFNQLTSSALTGGQLVLVPRVNDDGVTRT